MTTSITTRAAKGSALTHGEVDANFTNLKATADAAIAPGAAATEALTANTSISVVIDGHTYKLLAVAVP